LVSLQIKIKRDDERIIITGGLSMMNGLQLLAGYRWWTDCNYWRVIDDERITI